MARFFIDRPIFAWVIALFIMVVGAVAITQLPGSNALSTAEAVRAELEDASKSFPPGLAYRIPYNPTEYIEASISAVEHTLIEAIVLVALVVLLFLQSWRAAIIPIIAIPVSLVGAFAALAAFGFSLTTCRCSGWCSRSASSSTTRSSSSRMSSAASKPVWIQRPPRAAR